MLTNQLNFRDASLEEFVVSSAHFSGSATLRKAFKFICENYAEDITLDDISAAAGVSKFCLCRIFQRKFNISPIKWLWNYRARISAEFLQIAPHWQLIDIAIMSGYGNPAHFCRHFKKVFAMTPGQYRAKIQSQKKSDFSQNISNGFDGQNEALVRAFNSSLIAQ